MIHLSAEWRASADELREFVEWHARCRSCPASRTTMPRECRQSATCFRGARSSSSPPVSQRGCVAARPCTEATPRRVPGRACPSPPGGTAIESRDGGFDQSVGVKVWLLASTAEVWDHLGVESLTIEHGRPGAGECGLLVEPAKSVGHYCLVTGHHGAQFIVVGGEECQQRGYRFRCRKHDVASSWQDRRGASIRQCGGVERACRADSLELAAQEGHAR